MNVYKCPFAFDTPNLHTGANLYTPNVGDILLDAWVELVTAWDGTTPRADFGTFVSSNQGWYGSYADLTLDFGAATNGVDYSGQFDDNLLSSGGALTMSWNAAPTPYGPGVNLAALAMIYDVGGSAAVENISMQRAASKFLTADPIKAVVSRDGTKTGASPGSTQGEAILYLVVATPTLPPVGSVTRRTSVEPKDRFRSAEPRREFETKE